MITYEKTLYFLRITSKILKILVFLSLGILLIVTIYRFFNMT